VLRTFFLGRGVGGGGKGAKFLFLYGLPFLVSIPDKRLFSKEKKS